jgi:hypothetical protein
VIDVSLHPGLFSAVSAQILGQDITYKIGMPGRHMVMNSLAVLAAARWRARISLFPRWRLHNLSRPGRGVREQRLRFRRHCDADRRELQRQSGLDGGRDHGPWAAGPTSVRAGGASRCSATCWNSATGPAACRACRADQDERVDLVVCCRAADARHQRLPLHHLPHRRRDGHGALFVFMFGPRIIAALRIRRARASRSARTGRRRIC